MKTKSKALALMEVAIVLCSMLLVALPSIATEQTTQKVSATASEVITTSEDDDTFTLDIYGNANEDDTIDMRDTTYIKLAIFGKKPKTDLADANYDGKVSMLDVGQTKLIILGKEKELTVIDPDGETATVHKPIETIVVGHYSRVEIIRTLGAVDRIVGIDRGLLSYAGYFPELMEKPCIAGDVEAILELWPDAVIIGSRRSKPDMGDKLKGTGIDVVRMQGTKSEKMLKDIMMLGYILDEEKNAQEYVEWHEGYSNTIRARVSEISEDEKPKVFLDASSGKYKPGTRTYGSGNQPDTSVGLAGGKNIGHDFPVTFANVDLEWVIEQNPDVIIGREYGAAYGLDDVSKTKAYYAAIISAPGFNHIRAVKDDRVYTIKTIILWGPAYLIGVTYLAKWFHPDLFEDLDPQAVHQEYIDRFQRIDFDVSKHGVFVYHPEKYPDGR